MNNSHVTDSDVTDSEFNSGEFNSGVNNSDAVTDGELSLSASVGTWPKKTGDFLPNIR